MANEERNALAELAEELGHIGAMNAVRKARRIIAELAKVMWYKAENGEVPFYPTGLGDIISNCRAIAEEGAKDDER